MLRENTRSFRKLCKQSCIWEVILQPNKESIELENRLVVIQRQKTCALCIVELWGAVQRVRGRPEGSMAH